MRKRYAVTALAVLFITVTSLAKSGAQDAGPPGVVRAAAPVYPVAVRAANIEGEVTVEATIDSAGRVIETKFINPSKLKILHKAVEMAASRWKFEPNPKGSHKRKVQLVFLFRLVPKKEEAITFIPPYRVEVAGSGFTVVEGASR